MKITNIKIVVLFFLFLVIFSHPLFSQKVVYEYDLAGNRVSRTIILDSQRAKANPEEEIEPSIDFLDKREIQIFPNPTEGNLQVRISDMEKDTEGLIQIYTLNGTLLQTLPAIGSQTHINLSDSPSGTYIMVITIDGETTSWKIIKQ